MSDPTQEKINRGSCTTISEDYNKRRPTNITPQDINRGYQ